MANKDKDMELVDKYLKDLFQFFQEINMLMDFFILMTFRFSDFRPSSSTLADPPPPPESSEIIFLHTPPSPLLVDVISEQPLT